MPLNILRYRHDNRIGWGIVRRGAITPVPGSFVTTGELLAHTTLAGLAKLDAPTLLESQVETLSPVTQNQRFVCQGANYRQHMIESGMDPDVKNFNMIFTKASSCITGANSDVVMPHSVRYLDYEIELGLVIGKPIVKPERITDADLAEFVAGIVIVNDYSARDVQIPQMQFYKGKSFRTFGPVGPYLCLLAPEDLPLLKALELRLCVNDELRQSDSTANLVYGPAETLTELSAVHDFAPGDLLATGTPAGCALAIPSPRLQRIASLLPERRKWELFLKAQARRSQYLKPGDRVEAGIRSPDGRIDLGRQINRIVVESAAMTGTA